ncbi:MAG TPA: endonuclease/exonuclease/phosphatase family protein [Saprospiraceae bacterium]|nr:endonuclease/exonuclease/phosphatase family protein [Saprospiraceae bacterium]
MQFVVKIFNIKSIQLIIAALIILGAVFCIFTPNYFLFKWGESFAVQIMFGYLAAGIIFLMFRMPRLMFTSFACCAGLAMYLKDASNGNLIYPARTNGPVIEVANFNVSSAGDDFMATIEQIIETDADVISVQEIDPNWDKVLKEALVTEYPYSATVFRPVDFLGIGIFSKSPLIDIDTFYYQDIPNLKFKTQIENRDIDFLSAYIYPELNSKDYKHTQAHFNTLCSILSSEQKNPFITLGDFNEVQWSAYVRDFRKQCHLNDSRRFPTWVERPTDHIFYTNQLECVGFKSIRASNAEHFGIKGTYQFKPIH